MAAFVPLVFIGLIIIGLFVVAMMQIFGGKEDHGHKGDAHKTTEEEILHKQMKPKPKPDEDNT
ncbi:MAG: hypothetical protein JJU29_05655 [Verrucomicrobia bacterium]|nr:hypothetical protein [Verrucomicrobiota bacterium]MCH8511280.1 hypothetical protein [Kiritimatiellia bacterium]